MPNRKEVVNQIHMRGCSRMTDQYRFSTDLNCRSTICEFFFRARNDTDSSLTLSHQPLRLNRSGALVEGDAMVVVLSCDDRLVIRRVRLLFFMVYGR